MFREIHILRKFQKKFQGCFKNISINFVLQLCYSINLIAATPAEGGHVSEDFKYVRH